MESATFLQTAAGAAKRQRPYKRQKRLTKKRGIGYNEMNDG